jgi:hypothetical protein
MTLTSREQTLLSNTDVLGYIQTQNAERNAQAVAEGWEFWTLMAESLADECSNVYELELRFAEGTYSDVYKEWCGCRPSSVKGYTLVELEEKIEEYSRLAQEEYEAELAWRAEEEKLDREEIALGLAEPTEEVELEEWEIYEAKAEAAGY